MLECSGCLPTLQEDLQGDDNAMLLLLQPVAHCHDASKVSLQKAAGTEMLL